MGSIWTLRATGAKKPFNSAVSNRSGQHAKFFFEGGSVSTRPKGKKVCTPALYHLRKEP